ncbi:MAG: PLP-dependent aminotransferase family protein [Proteobacteria bacterium]|nr:PLP-dependent aminotransferase family protein [Pseudomonadota bacterium]
MSRPSVDITDAPTPVYRQIADQLRDHVAAGRLAAGERLPPIRALAQELGVHRDTVALAYDALAEDGLVESTVGRGTFVRERSAPSPEPTQRPFAAVLTNPVERLLAFERTRTRVPLREGVVPLHALVPDPALYPIQEFRRAFNRVVNEGGPELFLYGGPQGYGELRRVLAARFADADLSVDADDLVLCHGASQGISLAVRLFAEPGDAIAVETPTYHNTLGTLYALGMRPEPIFMDSEGPDLDSLERALARPEVKAFYTIPSFHNPLGTTAGLARRRGVLEVASRCGKPVIEDAFEMDLRYTGRRVPALYALDESGLVVHLFSFSKSLFPGVRVGSVCARGRLVEALLALKHATDLSDAMPIQAALAAFIEGGHYDRHLGRLRKVLRSRAAALREALAEHMPEGARWTEPEGGYQVWVDLPGDVDTRDLLPEAERAGVLFAPGAQFMPDGRASSGLRLTVAQPDEEAIRRGVAALGQVIRDHADRMPRRRANAVHI